MNQNHHYRNLVNRKHRILFKVDVKETDLFVYAEKNLEEITRELVLKYRGHIEAYINRFPQFAQTLTPWMISGPTPMIIQSMAKAGQIAGVGPMAAVAGAIAEYVGTELLSYTTEVIIENGGDIFLKTKEPVTIGIFAGKSPLNLRIGLQIHSEKKPTAVCTSSGTIGHSLSLGKADAVCVVSDSCCLADAAATAIGNCVKSKTDIQTAIDFGKSIQGLKGLVIIIADKIGLWGELQVMPLKGKNG